MQKLIHQLLQLQIKEKGYSNLVFSPLSLEILMKLILLGTQGKIREELLTTLELTEAGINRYLAELQTNLESFNTIKNTELHLANSLWHPSNTKVQDHYVNALGIRLPFEIKPLGTSSTQNQQSIDQWVNKKTNGFIPPPPVSLNQNNEILFLSALYLKGFWQQKFTLYRASVRPFYQLDGSQTEKVAFMYYKRDMEWIKPQTIHYFKHSSFHAIRIMLKDERLGFEVYLPFEHQGLSKFLDELKADDFDHWKSEFQPISYYYILLPKFEIENQLNFKEQMQNLGIQSLFKPSNDLAFMFEGNQPLHLNDLQQNTKIKIKEEGLEAAAVTRARGIFTGSPPPEQQFPMTRFEADHPFFYRVVDTVTNSVFFQGIFTKPEIPEGNAREFNFKVNLNKYKTRLKQDLEGKEKVMVALVLVETMLVNNLDSEVKDSRKRHFKALNSIWQALSLPLSNFIIKKSSKKHHRWLEHPNAPWYDPTSISSFEMFFADIIGQLRQKNFDDLDLSNAPDFLKHQYIKIPDYDYLVALIKKRIGKQRYKKVNQDELKFIQPPKVPKLWDMF